MYGSLERPLHPNYLKTKFESNCSVLGVGYADRFFQTLDDLPRASDAKLVSNLRLI